MIGKVPKAGRGFRGVVAYLLHGEKKSPNPDRVAWTATRNLLTNDPELVPKLMRATAAQSRRCESPVYHYVISWHRDENPTEDLMRQVADTTCADLDLNEHQALYIAHNDTDHRHVHIVVNRVHPETGKAWNRRQDYVRIERSLRRQSEVMGLDYVPGRHNDPERFKAKSHNPDDAEYQLARRRMKPAPRPSWSRERIEEEVPDLSETFAKAHSWAELDRALTARGLSMEEKGQGVVVGDDEGTMKLSDLRRDVRLKSLEGRFGESWKAYSAARQLNQAEPTQTPREADQLIARDSATEFDELRQLRAQTDLAFTLHGIGFVTDAQLQRSLAEQEAAQQKATEKLSLSDRIGREIGQALASNDSEPEPGGPETMQENETPGPRRKRRRERGRSM